MSELSTSLHGTFSAQMPNTLHNRVPAVTAEFWLIKLMAVTMGETAADYLAVNLGFGLTTTSLIMSAILICALVVQFAQKRYMPWSYWLSVVLISIVGTLVTDNLVDNFGVSLLSTTILFALALTATFAVWFASERTLSIHAIFTWEREAFYWLAISVHLCLGNGVRRSGRRSLRPRIPRHRRPVRNDHRVPDVRLFLSWPRSNPRFWLAYIFTRPLGASFGDLLSQPLQYGGLGLGTIITSALFLGTIIAIVVWISVTRRG